MIRLPFAALCGMIAWLLVGFIPARLQARSSPPTPPPVLVLVIGAPGEPGYATNFVSQATLWTEAAQRQGTRVLTIGLSSEETPEDRTRLETVLTDESKDTNAALWLVLIGHGTFDGKEARFNLRGTDLTATELATWLAPFQRPLTIINTASASSPFLQKLARTNRIVITATRSGYEQNATRFGQAFAEALLDSTADLDADAQTSILEAFLSASQRVASRYQEDGRLLTEHALIDDNGDGLGTSPDWYRGLRPIKKPKEGKSLDGLRAHQVHLIPSAAEQKLSPEVRARRDELERRLAALRDRKASLTEDAYYAELATLLLELAVLYRDAETPAR